MDKLPKIQGSLLGLAIGDAVGTTVEFLSKGSFTPLTDMVGGGVFGLEKGQWTDDTSMALCLADSLIARQGFDAKDQMERYLRWYEMGENSSTGECFDIGGATRQALEYFKETGEIYAGSKDKYSSGNGSLMRLAPIACYYHDNINHAVEYAILSSRTTHQSSDCLSACAYFAQILFNIFNGKTNKDQLLLPSVDYEWSEQLLPILNGDFKYKSENQIFGTGYVIDSLETALWAFYHSDNFADAILMAANLGNDADTTAAITGQIAGAYYGLSGIPIHWQETVYWNEHILELAKQLFKK
ncbi:ADP-ribosylglycohydrolase family protein [Moraxella nasicaprae]|uniref:ADP-ribosylglycohydrolase family protein n=1 Tax=Moraxella nasicaprae TaxID=2904122 RepID=A0ABY6F2T4_9GAMM|nr:ADP-ribosylglycohydrolase family protein [Moraxella nasicaprae]UXZ04307.1 ADP-ribosylglycohydrolase family protein [Moraxella nasicaprae]